MSAWLRWGVLAALAVTAQAQPGTTRLYFSFTGMSESLRYSPARTNFLPGFEPDTPLGPTIAAGDGNHDLFLWGEFVNMPSYARLQGLQLQITGTAPFVDADSVIYRQNKTGLNPYRRWDGDTPILVNGGIMAAVVATGVVNWTSADAAPNDLVILPTADEGTRFLLGVVRVVGAQPGQDLTVRLADGLSYPSIILQDGTVIIPSGPPPAVTITFVPEPAGMLLAGVALVLLRRR